MAKSNKFNLKQAEQKARKALEAAIVDVGNTAKTFFVENFRKQGFDDKTVQKWKPRKVADKRAGRAILVKTGDLRRSIIRNPANRAALTVKISTDLAYAKIHNEGGTINKGERSGKVNFRINKDGGFRGGRAKFVKEKKSNFQMDVNIGAHSIAMPKRQFMGDSYNLNEKVKAVIVKRLDKVFT